MSDQRILLFGRTGAGKSTLGNMLHARHPSPQGGFPVGDGIRGVTYEVSRKVGHGWEVVDTIGMGEARGGTVSTAEAERRLVDFLRKLRFTYNYIVYVVRKGRMEDAQGVTWEMFKKLFEGGESNFVVVFTGADQAWLDREMIDIQRAFLGCTRFCAVNIRPVEEGDPEMETMNEVRRIESIEALERRLRSFNLSPITPKITRMTELELLAHARDIFRDLCIALANRIANSVDPMRWILNNIMARFF